MAGGGEIPRVFGNQLGGLKIFINLVPSWSVEQLSSIVPWLVGKHATQSHRKVEILVGKRFSTSKTTQRLSIQSHKLLPQTHIAITTKSTTERFPFWLFSTALMFDFKNTHALYEGVRRNETHQEAARSSPNAGGLTQGCSNVREYSPNRGNRELVVGSCCFLSVKRHLIVTLSALQSSRSLQEWLFWDWSAFWAADRPRQPIGKTGLFPLRLWLEVRQKMSRVTFHTGIYRAPSLGWWSIPGILLRSLCLLACTLNTTSQMDTF